MASSDSHIQRGRRGGSARGRSGEAWVPDQRVRRGRRKVIALVAAALVFIAGCDFGRAPESERADEDQNRHRKPGLASGTRSDRRVQAVRAYYRSLARVPDGPWWESQRAWSRLAPAARREFGGFEEWRSDVLARPASLTSAALAEASRRRAVVAVRVKVEEPDHCWREPVSRRWRGSWRVERVRGVWLLADADLSLAPGERRLTRRGDCPPDAVFERVVRDYYRSLTRAHFGERSGSEWKRAWSLLAPAARAKFGGFDKWRADTNNRIAALSVSHAPLSATSAAVFVDLRTLRFDACGHNILEDRAGKWWVERLRGKWLLTKSTWSPARTRYRPGRCRERRIPAASARAAGRVVGDYYLALMRAGAGAAHPESSDVDWRRAWSRLSADAQRGVGGFESWRASAWVPGTEHVSVRPLTASAGRAMVAVRFPKPEVDNCDIEHVSHWSYRLPVTRIRGKWVIRRMYAAIVQSDLGGQICGPEWDGGGP